jgi:hypothetical protein
VHLETSRKSQNRRQFDPNGPPAQVLTRFWMTIGMISSACSDWISNSDGCSFFMRFALLHHQLPPSAGRQDHWDLLLQHGDGDPNDATLTCFEMPNPSIWDGIRVRRLADHRQLYLDFEGEIESSRGTVSAVRRGALLWLEIRDDSMIVQLSNSEREAEIWCFGRVDENGWIVKRVQHVSPYRS